MLQAAESRQKRILDADYSAVDIDEHIDAIPDLDVNQKYRLKEVLKSHPTLFGGGLGILDIPPVHFEIKPDAKPYHA